MYDIAIIGAGPAGMTAALYAQRAGKSTVVFENNVIGGQITYSPKVENYPGFNEISGNDFADKLYSQITNLGAKVIIDEVVLVEKNNGYYDVTAQANKVSAKSIIFATGTTHRKLGIESENKFVGRGVSYCAVCDGMFFKGLSVAVVGGGNSALQEALYLSSICEKVYLIHRRDAFRADKALVDKARKKGSIEFILNSNVIEISGKLSVESVTLLQNDTEKVLDVKGVFVAIGHEPKNSLFINIIPLNEQGYGVVNDDCTVENGIYVAGDCRAKSVRQLVTAVSDGALAAVNACNYIDSL